MDCCGCIIPLLFIGIIGTIIYFATNADKKMLNDSWGRFAASFGLTLTPGNFMMAPQVSGKYNGFDFLLHRVTRDNQTDKGTYTEIVMRVPPCGDYNLELYKKDFLFRMMADSVLRSDRFIVHTDDEIFDANFVIKSHTPEKVDIILTPEVRNLILAKRDIMHLVINVSSMSYLRELKWFTPQIISDAYVLKQMTEILTTIATNISKNRIGMTTERQIPEKDPFLPEKAFEPTAPENYLETSRSGYYYEEDDKSITFVKDVTCSIDDVNSYEVEIEPEINVEDSRKTRIVPSEYIHKEKIPESERDRKAVSFNEFSVKTTMNEHIKEGKSKKRKDKTPPQEVGYKDKMPVSPGMGKHEEEKKKIYEEMEIDTFKKPLEVPTSISPSADVSFTEIHPDVTQTADPSHYDHEHYTQSLYSADTPMEEVNTPMSYEGLQTVDVTHNTYTPEEVDSSSQYINASSESYFDEVTQTADPTQYASGDEDYDKSLYTVDTSIHDAAQYDIGAGGYSDTVQEVPYQYDTGAGGYSDTVQEVPYQYDTGAGGYSDTVQEVPYQYDTTTGGYYDGTYESNLYGDDRICPCCSSPVEAGLEHCKICGMQIE